MRQPKRVLTSSATCPSTISFALALLDENNDGFVMNSVHSSDGSYCYTKVIQNGECELSLGDEEAKAIRMAMEEE